MALLLNPTVGLADCNWKEGIWKRNNADGYIYTENCHRAVGVIKKTNKLREKEIVELRGAVDDLKSSNKNLNKSIKLKDLAIVKADESANRWRQETSPFMTVRAPALLNSDLHSSLRCNTRDSGGRSPLPSDLRMLRLIPVAGDGPSHALLTGTGVGHGENDQ